MKRKAKSVTKSRAEEMGCAVEGAIVGGLIAGPIGFVAGAAAGALVEKGPARKKGGALRAPDERSPDSSSKPRDTKSS